MGWFRERSRPAACVALLALVLQLALSFGHVHFGHVHLAQADHPASTAADVAGHKGTPQQPGNDHQDNYCAVYAVLTLLGGAMVATAPIVPAHAALAAPEVPAATEAVRVGPPHRAYQPRAPPRA
jgi:hypothetical protein